ncbi:hypothetical protein [Aquitalea magnusonii]|uniref:J domain-containing protein n=1 Tax=Aquitalea magnusonii TaxID=332411 RepID=A0A318JLU9_9NEIS|nr:hypothetical protein [Aquitalea magnusonii]PXX48999.1 hypothetical protein DFR38_10535 [Aquitalea magnusonii]
MSQSLYDFLGVQNNAAPEAIRSAINSIAEKHRADGADATQARMLSLCAEILLFPEKRIEYDRRQREKLISDGNISNISCQDDLRRIDSSVLLVTLPIALSAPIMLFVAIGPLMVIAKAVAIAMYGVMSAIVGVIAARELYGNSKSDDPLPSFLIFLVIMVVFPVGYVWYMSCRSRYGLRGMLFMPIAISIISLFLFIYPAVRSDRIVSDVIAKQKELIINQGGVVP